ncbi:unnamed protein product [Echinostoma caproni]|uniref:BACK domain-containing protein n=1 Tax=Echinostoma caproni TaxID=27848 RepID=A0A183A9A5_9TREM|nr:unnamed protein product [Echinostoma caproni]
MKSPGTALLNKSAIPKQHRSPEAGDTRANQAIPTHETCESKAYVPMNLLSDYTMQWALNRTLCLINTGQTIRVNAYKLATQSDVFWDLIRQTSADLENPVRMKEKIRSTSIGSSRSIRLIKHIERWKSLGRINSNTLLIDCPSLQAISDILLAVHFCHTEHCHIVNRIPTNPEEWIEILLECDQQRHETDEPDSGSGRRGTEYDLIYRTNEWILCTGISVCTLGCALRVANTYSIIRLREKCYRFIETHVNLSNCWYMWRASIVNIGHRKNVPPTQTLQTLDPIATELVERYILTNIRHFIRPAVHDGNTGYQVGFQTLSCEEMEYFLTSNELNVRKESEVIQAIDQWMQAPVRANDTISCFVSTPRLLTQCVRIDQLELNDLERIYEFPCLKDRLRFGQMTTNDMADSHSEPYDPLVWKQIQRSRVQCHAAFGQIRRKLVRFSRNLRPLGDRPKRLSEVPRITTNHRSESQSEKPADRWPIGDVRIPHETILLFGGWKCGRPCRDVSVLDARQKIWTTYSADSKSEDEKTGITANSSVLDRLVLPYALMSFGIALVGNRYIYIAGGELASTQTTSRMIRFDVAQATTDVEQEESGWKLCSSLHESRRDLVLVNVKDIALYAIGGDNNRTVLSCVERFPLDPQYRFDGQGWCLMPNMLIPRGAPAADALHDIIYVCGGYTESRMESLTNSCEAFDTRTNQWTFIEPMSQARYYAHAVSVQGVLFVLGGGGESGTRGGAVTRVPAHAGYISTVERYNPETATWELMPPTTERADFAACLFEGELVCLGGGGATFGTDEVERWTPWLPGSTEATQHPNNSNQWAAQLPLNIPTTMNEASVPLWLTPSLIPSTQQESLGWQPYVRLPTPVWGHRCVVLRGIDRIRPYLNRTDKLDGQTRPTTCRLTTKSLCAQCVLIGGHPVLTVLEGTCEKSCSDSGSSRNQMDSTVLLTGKTREEQLG